jgi:hypothetical protein
MVRIDERRNSMATLDTPVRTHVILPAELLAKIDARAGKRGRSAYIARVVGEALDREERLRIFEDMPTFEDPNPDWATPEAADAWVRKIREESDARVDELWADHS